MNLKVIIKFYLILKIKHIKKNVSERKKVKKDFEYSSDKNSDWMKISQLRKLLNSF